MYEYVRDVIDSIQISTERHIFYDDIVNQYCD